MGEESIPPWERKSYQFAGPGVAISCEVEFDKETKCWKAKSSHGYLGSGETRDDAALACFRSWVGSDETQEAVADPKKESADFVWVKLDREEARAVEAQMLPTGCSCARCEIRHSVIGKVRAALSEPESGMSDAAIERGEAEIERYASGRVRFPYFLASRVLRAALFGEQEKEQEEGWA